VYTIVATIQTVFSYTQLYSAILSYIQQYVRSIQKIASYTQKYISGIQRFLRKSFPTKDLITDFTDYTGRKKVKSVNTGNQELKNTGIQELEAADYLIVKERGKK
jgi:hypothetical protein